MTGRTVLVTGAAGGIGGALVEAFGEAGWHVIATDRFPTGPGDGYIPADLAEIAADGGALSDFADAVRQAMPGEGLDALVNNAALQVLGNLGAISLDDWERTMRINLTAPLLLSQALLPELRAARGTIVNIGSVHAQATKREFVSYATSKAAIHGLTRAMAVDVGENPRVVCIAPAAVATPMLEAGFEGLPEARAQLEDAHLSRRIAAPTEIGRAAVALCEQPFLFATGSTIWLDGGVLSRLYDPA